MSEGAIGAELAEWRKELATQNRTIADEMAAHSSERLSKSATISLDLANDPSPGIMIATDYQPIELEFIR